MPKICTGIESDFFLKLKYFIFMVLIAIFFIFHSPIFFFFYSFFSFFSLLFFSSICLLPTKVSPCLEAALACLQALSGPARRFHLFFLTRSAASLRVHFRLSLRRECSADAVDRRSSSMRRPSSRIARRSRFEGN